jgi:hypothetical protein
VGVPPARKHLIPQDLFLGTWIAFDSVPGDVRRSGGRGDGPMRNAMIAWMVVAALLLGLSLGRAADANETTMTVQVSSAEHESDEGYFSLGKDTTVLAKPGTELHRYLSRQNGRQVRITMTMVDGKQLSKLER